jgi:hypothetical protein
MNLLLLLLLLLLLGSSSSSCNVGTIRIHRQLHD